jgi:Domain of unknown function (DUF4380)
MLARVHVLKRVCLGFSLVLVPARAAPPADAHAALVRLSNPSLTVTLIPGLGGRIVELRTAAGENLLDADPRYWSEPYPPAELSTLFAPWNGHTYWVGPQSAWWTQQDLDLERKRTKATWPPDPFHETARYDVRESSPSRVRLESPPSPITGLKRQLDVELLGPNRVRIRVIATNVRATPVAWSIYSNTRVRPDGWAYVPLVPNGIQRIDGPKDESGRYPHRVERGFFVSPPGVASLAGRTPRTADTYLRPTEGYIAYFRGRQLMRKHTEVFDERRLHPEETLVEIYRSSGAGPDAPLLELEIHGPYESLASGQSLSFEETWEVLDYPGPAEPGAHMQFLEGLPTREVRRNHEGRSLNEPSWAPDSRQQLTTGDCSSVRRRQNWNCRRVWRNCVVPTSPNRSSWPTP